MTWVPGDVTGLEADYNPMVGVTVVTGSVTAVADQSGKGEATRNLVTTTPGVSKVKISAADAGYNSKDVFHFDRAQQDQCLENAAAWTTPLSMPYTVYIVGDCAGADGVFWTTGVSNVGGFHHFAYANDNTGAGGPTHSAIIQEFDSGNQAVTNSGSAARLNAPSIQCYTIDSTVKAYVNDPVTSYCSASNLGSYGLNGIQLGWAVSPFSIQGKIGRAIVYSGNHDETTRRQVMSRFSDIFNITIDNYTVDAGAVIGAATLSISSSGSINGIGPLVGTSSITVAGSGTLKGTGNLTGTSTASLSASSSINGLSSLVAAAAISLVAAGTLTSIGPLTGAGTIAISASGTLIDAPPIYGPLTGAGSIALISTGSLSGIKLIVGTSTIAFTVPYALLQDLNGTASVVGVRINRAILGFGTVTRLIVRSITRVR